MSLNDPEPPPIPTNGRPTWDLVISDAKSCHVSAEIIADMRERHLAGVRKYGTPLTAANGRDHLVDAYQELLDFVVYLRAEIDKRGSGPGSTVRLAEDAGQLATMYGAAMGMLTRLHEIIQTARAS